MLESTNLEYFVHAHKMNSAIFIINLTKSVKKKVWTFYKQNLPAWNVNIYIEKSHKLNQYNSRVFWFIWWVILHDADNVN